MMEREPQLIYSPLNGDFTKDDVTIQIVIISSDIEPLWTLEVVNSSGTSIVWDLQFETDEQAFAEFRRTVEEEGMIVFSDDEHASNVIPFPRPH